MSSEPQRVALAVSEYVAESPHGGLANYTYRLAQGLLELGVTPEVFFPGARTAAALHDGVLVHSVGWRRRWLGRAARKAARALCSEGVASETGRLHKVIAIRRALARRHARRPFDLVQYGHLGGLGAWRLAVPSVIRLSSYADLWLVHGFRESTPFERFLEDVALRRADAVFGPGRWVAEYVASKLHIEVEVIESPFVPPGGPEDPSLFARHLQGKPYGLYFGALAEYKGVYLLAEAVDDFLDLHPDYRFVWVGGHRDPYREGGQAPPQRILERLRRHRDRLLFLGPLGHPQLFPILRGARFVALPSLADNLSNAGIETLSQGQVLIGTDGRSFEQLIRDGESGFLCTPGDVGSLLSAMRRAAGLGDAERRAMGERARERVGALRPEIAVARLLELYRRVLGGGARGAATDP